MSALALEERDYGLTITTKIVRSFTEQQLAAFLSEFRGKMNTQEVRAEITAWIMARTTINVEVTDK